MLERYSSGQFAALAFFVLVAYVAYSVGSTTTLESVERREADRAARQHSIYADQHIASACADLTGTELIVCAQEQIKRSAEYQNAEYDLSAQEQMATYAKWLLWVSVASIGVTGLGIFLVWGTLAETRKATIAAQDAVGVTREIGEAQVRAYISSAGVRPLFVWKDERLQSIMMSLAIQNTGQSPAKLSRMYTFLFIGEPGARPEATFGVHEGMLSHVLGAQNHFDMVELSLEVETASKIWSEVNSCYLLGWASYSTVFDKPGTEHELEFCYSVTFRLDPSTVKKGSEGFMLKFHSMSEFSINPHQES